MRWDSSDRGKRLAHMGSRKALKRKIDPERRRLAAGTAAWMLRVPHSSPLADPLQQLPGPLAFEGRLLLDLSVQMRESCLERGLRADVHPGAVGCCRTLHVQIQLDEDRTRWQNDPSAGMAAHSPTVLLDETDALFSRHLVQVLQQLGARRSCCRKASVSGSPNRSPCPRNRCASRASPSHWKS